MPLPVEVAAVDNGTAERRAMAAQKLSERIHNNIRSMLDGAKQNGRGHGVIDNKRNTVRMGNSGKGLKVADISGWISNAFTKNSARLLVDQARDVVGAIACRKTNGNAHPRQNVREERMRGAVELGNGDDVASQFCGVQNSVVHGRLPAAHAHGFKAAFKRGDAPFKHGCGWILNTRVAKTLGFEIEQSRGMFGAVEGVSDGLVDRHSHGLCRRVNFVAAMDCDRFRFHLFRPSEMLLTRSCGASSPIEDCSSA